MPFCKINTSALSSTSAVPESVFAHYSSLKVVVLATSNFSIRLARSKQFGLSPVERTRARCIGISVKSPAMQQDHASRCALLVMLHSRRVVSVGFVRPIYRGGHE